MTPKGKRNISKALKGNSKLSEAIRQLHARRIASGEDAKIREKIKATHE